LLNPLNPKRVSQFSISKIGENDDDNKDSVTYSEKFNRFALSDGVSGASYSREWAHLLTTGFVKNPFVKNDFDIKSWITPLQIAWYNTVPWESLQSKSTPEYMLRKAEDGGAATFLGGLFFTINEKTILKICALGDTNLFLVRGNENILSFPLTVSEEFGIDPDMFFSLPKDVNDPTSSQVGKLLYTEIDIQKDDLLICASDSISNWYVDSLKNPFYKSDGTAILPWIKLEQISSKDEFRNFITEKVNCKKMKNDDSTLLILRF
jgi:hypothetical protein